MLEIAMLEILYLTLWWIGASLGAWLLPMVSGGRVTLAPWDHVPTQWIWPWDRLPNGQIVVPADLCGLGFIAACVAALFAYRFVERLVT